MNRPRHSHPVGHLDRFRRPCFGLALLIAAASAAVSCGEEAAAPAAVPQVFFRGSITLPDSATDATGSKVAITGLSGITWLGDDRYVAVMDNSQYLLSFRLSLTQAGKPVSVESLRIVTLSQRHDYEDVVPCPAVVAQALRQSRRPDRPVEEGRPDEECVLVCEEDTPAIRGFSLDDGEMVGAVPVPENLRSRRPNRGLESLAIEPDGRFLWTANEEALPADGPPAAAGGGTVVRLTRLPLPGAEPQDRNAAPPVFQAAYAVDPVHRFVRVFAGQSLSGLSALASLGRGRLLALERSGAAGLPPFHSRIFLVDAGAGVDVSAVEKDLATRKEAVLEKRLLWSDSLGINLEGLCLGPRLGGGNRALVAIADNGGLGTPNQLVGLELVAPPAGVDLGVLGVVAALIAIAVLVGRLTSP